MLCASTREYLEDHAPARLCGARRAAASLSHRSNGAKNGAASGPRRRARPSRRVIAWGAEADVVYVESTSRAPFQAAIGPLQGQPAPVSYGADAAPSRRRRRSGVVHDGGPPSAAEGAGRGEESG
jgi:hypothetical protein